MTALLAILLILAGALHFTLREIAKQPSRTHRHFGL